MVSLNGGQWMHATDQVNNKQAFQSLSITSLNIILTKVLQSTYIEYSYFREKVTYI